MKHIALIVSALLLTAAAPAPKPPQPSPEKLRATVAALVSFGTRHTLSSATDPKRGIGAARRWTADQFAAISAACGTCLTLETIGEQVTGPRAPDGVLVENVFATQHGTSDPNRVIIIQAHIDSRVTDVMNFTADSPGANDDASGVALVMEAARILSKEKFPATIVYAVLSGEEQGLWGGRLLAKTAKERGWNVAAVLNNDIVGNTHGIGGERTTDKVRVFSEGISAAADLDALKAQRAMGGEDDSPSRSLAKAIKRVAMAQPGLGLEVIAVRRADRFQRGGDHIPFMEAGFPAVRFTEMSEHYDHQHQDVRTEAGRPYGDTIDKMDFPYLARVTAVNLAVTRELARAPAAPVKATIEGAVSADTTVSWTASPEAAGYRIRWRRADGFEWTNARDVPATQLSLALKGVNIDYTFFAVAALAATGEESVATFAGPVPRPPPGAVR